MWLAGPWWQGDLPPQPAELPIVLLDSVHRFINSRRSCDRSSSYRCGRPYAAEYQIGLDVQVRNIETGDPLGD